VCVFYCLIEPLSLGFFRNVLWRKANGVYGRLCVTVCACLCLCARVCACMCVYVYIRMSCMPHALHDSKIQVTVVA